MKYSNENKPLVCMQTQSTCYKGTSKMTIKGVLWHSTGANQPALRRYVQPSDVKPAEDTYTKEKWLEVLGKNRYGNDWNHNEREAGLNCWIGQLADGSVETVQTMPWNYRPWGCGGGSKGSCNDGWIQFEICESTLTDEAYFNEVYKEGVEITAYLCKLHNIDPKGTVSFKGLNVPTILCHQDSAKLGLGSNHADILHWFKKHNKTMDDVRNDVAALLDAEKPMFKVGDLVQFVGGNFYSNNGGGTTKVAKAGPAKITRIVNGKYPYHVVHTDDTTEVHGWVATSSVEEYVEVIPAKEYVLVVNVKGYPEASQAKADEGPGGPFAAGTYYIHPSYPDGKDGMICLCVDPKNPGLGFWINPANNVIKTEEPKKEETIPEVVEPTVEPEVKPEVVEPKEEPKVEPEVKTKNWADLIINFLKKIVTLIIDLINKK